MNRHPLIHAAASAALALFAATAAATPGPPLGCTGVPGVGGCAPYLNISLSDGAGVLNLYEYDLPQIDISRSLTQSDARVTGNLQLANLTVSSRLASDGNPSTLLAVDVGSALVDLFTLDSGGLLPPGANVSITVTGSAQGVGSIDADYHVVQSLLHLGSGSGVVGYHGGVLDAGRVIQSVTHWPTFQQFVLPLQVYANLTVQVGVPFELNLSLRSIITESSFMNFDSFFGLAHGAQLSFALPANFSVTSMGGFDSAAPVPEPEALSLWLAGLGMLGLSLRRRARRFHPAWRSTSTP